MKTFKLENIQSSKHVHLKGPNHENDENSKNFMTSKFWRQECEWLKSKDPEIDRYPHKCECSCAGATFLGPGPGPGLRCRLREEGDVHVQVCFLATRLDSTQTWDYEFESRTDRISSRSMLPLYKIE